MKQISQILIKSQETRKQIRGSFVKGDGKPEAYCAIGALMCESGLVKLTSGETDVFELPSPRQVLDTFEIPKELQDRFLQEYIPCPLEGKVFPERATEDGGQCTDADCRICKTNRVCASDNRSYYDMVIHLNDGHHLSFKEIGQWLESNGF